jgi:Tannase and feruloyl esterase
VASQDGGHENTELPTPNTFLLEQQAVVDHAYGSIDATTQTAKFLINAFYGQQPNKSYFVGCSTGGRQGMVFSQNFPDYYEVIVAGETPANPAYNPLSFDFDKDIANLRKESPLIATSTSTDISKFKDRGGKIMWYHGVSDPGPPVLGTIAYFDALTAKNGAEETKKFARLYLVPNMGHCRGGPATDQFDLLTPLVNWVEHGTAPQEVIASGTNLPRHQRRVTDRCAPTRPRRVTPAPPAVISALPATTRAPCRSSVR